MDPAFPLPADQVREGEQVMNAASESWCCPSCGERFTNTPPDHRLCDDCLDQLESLGYAPAPGAPYGDLPPCPDCGGQMVEVMPVPQLPVLERGREHRE